MSEPLPVPMKAGDARVLVRGRPLEVDFRIVAEDLYRKMEAAYLPPPAPRDHFAEVRDQLLGRRFSHAEAEELVTLVRQAAE